MFHNKKSSELQDKEKTCQMFVVSPRHYFSYWKTTYDTPLWE